MKIIVLGAGKVGEALVESFIKEKYDVVVVDNDESVVASIVNRYDVRGIVGGGLAHSALLDAGVDTADLFVATTLRDEMNILACVLAKKLGAGKTVARVRNPEYFSEMENLRQNLGLDLAFNPELNTAKEIAQILKFPSALKVESFAEGKATMAEFEILHGNPIINKTLREIRRDYDREILFATIERNGKIIIPNGKVILEEGDKVRIMGSEPEMSLFSKKFKLFKPRPKSVFIVGGGNIGYYLAKELVDLGISVKILEKNKSRCTELAESLVGVSVICGDGTELETLEEEGLKTADACVTLTGIDEENVMISMYAGQAKVDKIITKVDRVSVFSMVKKLGLDSVILPKNIVANKILQFSRMHQVDSEGGINTLYKITDKAEALEFTVTEDFPKINMALSQIELKNNVLIIGVVRDEKFILPQGTTELKLNDRIIVVAESRKILKLENILK